MSIEVFFRALYGKIFKGINYMEMEDTKSIPASFLLMYAASF